MRWQTMAHAIVTLQGVTVTFVVAISY